jgi:O-antigen/teichoic acid export membrane protein
MAKSSAPSLTHGVFWTGLGTAIYLACQYGMLMAIAKLGSKALLGDFSLALAITAPIIILSQMQMRQGQVTDVKQEYTFAEYFYARIFLTFAALLVIAAVVGFGGYSPKLSALILVLGVAKSAESASDIVYGYLQARERMDLVALSMVVKGCLSLAVFIGLLWATGNLLYAATAMAVVWIILLVFLDRTLQQRVGRESLRFPRRLPRLIARLTVLSFPLALASGLAALSGNIPRYFLAAWHGSEAVAMYTVAASPLALINLLAYATSQATLARAAGAFQRGDYGSFNRIARNITALQCGLAGACTILFWLWGGRLLALLFSPDYAKAAPVLVTLAAGITIGSASAYGLAIYAAGRAFWMQPVPIFLGALLQTALCCWLAGPYGAQGAAWSDALKYLFCALFISFSGYLVLQRHRRRLQLQAGLVRGIVSPSARAVGLPKPAYSGSRDG